MFDIVFNKDSNIWNLGSKESIGVTFKEGIFTELCLKLWFEGHGLFVKLQIQNGFESDCPEKKL